MSRGKQRVNWTRLARAQKGFSLFFVAVSLGLPVYTSCSYGFRVLPVYDRFGNVVGHGNYFLLSLGMSAIGMVVSLFSYAMARYSLREMGASK